MKQFIISLERKTHKLWTELKKNKSQTAKK